MRRNLIYTCILLRFIYTKVRFRIKLPNLPKYENNYILTAKSLSEIGHGHMSKDNGEPGNTKG